ncbi:MAG: hypothetical protein RLZZ440_3059, partial [Planctomycetota bacterium]
MTHHASDPVASSSRPGILAAAGRGLSLVAVLACLALAWWWLATHHFTGGDHEPVTDEATTARPAADVVTVPENVTITLAMVELQPVQDELTVPGRLDYDARKQVDYVAPV